MHVAVTGASKGIGEAIARRFAATGASVTVVARSRQPLEALAASLGRPAHVAAVDLSDLPRCADWVAEAEAKLGPIDVLVNNAGRQVVGPLQDTPVGDAEGMMILDLLAPMRIVAAVAPGMLARRSGTIVNIASAAAFSWVPGMTYYNAAKSGLGAYGESLRAEWRGTGVNVLTVYPGPVQTAMAEEAMLSYGAMARWIPIGTADGLATRIVASVGAGRGRLVYPAVYAPLRWFPNLTRAVTAIAAPRAKTGDSNAPRG